MKIILFLLLLVVSSGFAFSDAFADHEQYLKIIEPNGISDFCSANNTDCTSFGIPVGEQIIFDLHTTGVYNPLDRIDVAFDKYGGPIGSDSHWAQFGNEGGTQNIISVIKNGEGNYQIIIDTTTISEGTHNILIDAIQTRNGPTRTFTSGDGYDVTIGSPPQTPIDGEFVLPCSMQEAGDGVSAGSCHGFYSNEIARAEVGINYHTGLLPIENYEATGYFLDEYGVQGPNINVIHPLINPGDFAILVFENSETGTVSEFTMGMVGGELVVEESDTIPPIVVVPNNMAIEATSNNPSPVTFSVSATDDTDGALTPACSHNSNSNFPIGLTTVTCTATDAAGNSNSKSFTITITYDEPEPTCGAGTELVNGICVVIENNEPEPDHPEVTIEAAQGSGAPGCEETAEGCYIPGTATVDVGGKVIFSNTDSAAHTFTSGDPTNPETSAALFDSGLAMAGSTFEWSPTEAGEVPYYCMVHPWMQGLIIVQEGDYDDSEPTPETDSSETKIDARATKSSYENGDTVLIIGSITNYDSSSGKALTYLIISPENDIIGIGQTYPNSYGSFEKSFVAGGPLWELNGDYIFKFQYGAGKSEVIVNYVGGEAVISEPEPTPTEPEQEDELEIISLSTKKSQYQTGDTIVITGKVNTSDFSKDVVLQVFTDGSLVDISQVPVSLSETFSHTIIAEGSLWMNDGKYTIKATYGEDSEDTSFIYRVSDSLVPEDELDYEVTIEAAQGSGAPGCEETSQGCYLPNIASVAVGGKVIFSNTDSAAHTFTSGDPTNPETVQVLFDSGLAMAGSTFEWSPTEEGVVDYFCMVHPWMQGIILVGEGTAPPPRPTPDTSIELQVSVNDDVYDLDDLVGINVEIDGISGSQKVAIDVTGPSGSTVISRSLTFTSDDEDGEIEFRISEEFKTGTYKVTATTSDDGNTIRDNAYFKVKSQYNSFKITSVETTDQQGNSSDLKAGEIGFIKVELESNKSIATLVTVNIFDYELTSIGIGSVKTTLSSGNSEIILSFMIPADAAVGPADIYANAFSDWPSNGGIPLTGEVSSVEDIQ